MGQPFHHVRVLVSRCDQRFQVFSPDQKTWPQPTHVFSLFVKIFLGRDFGEEAQREVTGADSGN